MVVTGTGGGRQRTQNFSEIRGASTGDHGDYSKQPGILTTHTKHTYVYQVYNLYIRHGVFFIHGEGHVRA